METLTKIDLANVAKNLELPADKVSSAVELLEAGNTIPFITRYRKDETGGLGERQLRDIKQEVGRQTALAERKTVVLKAIENQGQLTDELRAQIDKAVQARQIEDLYHPFKPRKTSLAETARQQGLEPLARDILEGHQPDIDLASRATDFVRVDKGLTSVDDVINGVRHILAERFSEHLQLRFQLRNVFWQDGKIKTELIATAKEPAKSTPEQKPQSATDAPVPAKPAESTADADTPSSDDHAATKAENAASPETNEAEITPSETTATAEQNQPLTAETQTAETQTAATELAPVETPQSATPQSATPQSATPQSETPQSETPQSDTVSSETAADSFATDTSDASIATETAVATASAATKTDKPKKKRKKKKKKKSRPDPFVEFDGFEESLQKIPPHRTLAINRGERAGKLKVRITCEPEKLNELARTALITEGHPFADFLTTVCDDALSRLILPGIEREIRRDLTERSESHAVGVFARNLRHLFLQPPVRGYRILGIDPGYRSGCKMAVIDETGQPLGHGVFSIVGNAGRIKNNKQRLIDMINMHQPQLIAIGNGSGCRAVEQFVSDVISGDLADRNIQYSIVNQAGTSTYSTSDLGQYELPDHDPVIRSAISIARRLQDPLSELVKVNPANVGVGLYQHDIKAKHLAESLESVVESCVNFVGVNANTASPSLLRYVSGLGQTTARKMVEHRNEEGPFDNRQTLRDVSGFGEVTFVQSAGFLRIQQSDNSLDGTSIHPEDYELATKILSKLGCSIEDLTPPPRPPRFAPPKTRRPVTASTPDTASEEIKPESAESSVAAGDQPGAEATIEQPVVAETAAAEATPATTETTETVSSEPAAEKETVATPPASETKTETPAAEETPAPTMSPAMIAEKRKQRRELVQKMKNLNIGELARELGVGEMKLRDLLRSLRNPVLDPRDDLPAPVFRKGILKFEDLKQGMQLRGQIVNVVDFGVFLNIGIGESCLVHISRLANRYVRDPHWYYSVGDVLNVWVQEVDTDKRRVTLTAIRPDSAKRERRKSRGEASAPGRRSRRDGGGRDGGSGKGKKRHGSGRGKSHHKRPRKPKPVKPITQEMVDGKEPMRSFSDLLQFHQKKTDDDDPKEKKQ